MCLKERFKKWYQANNGAIIIMTPCKESYIQGAIDERISLSSKIANCVTYEEIMALIRMEIDSIDQKGE